MGSPPAGSRVREVGESDRRAVRAMNPDHERGARRAAARARNSIGSTTRLGPADPAEGPWLRPACMASNRAGGRCALRAASDVPPVAEGGDGGRAATMVGAVAGGGRPRRAVGVHVGGPRPRRATGLQPEVDVPRVGAGAWRWRTRTPAPTRGRPRPVGSTSGQSRDEEAGAVEGDLHLARRRPAEPGQHRRRRRGRGGRGRRRGRSTGRRRWRRAR